MKRSTLLLTALGLIIVIVLFFVLVLQPSREELAEVEARIESEELEQQRLEQEIARLRGVREDAPGVEADLAAAEAIVPHDPALPALIRQLQLAADESGVTLASIATGRPAVLAGQTEDPAEEGLSSIDVNGQLSGTYFQMVDFLRRVEDPAITPRGILWNNVSVARADGDYPNLQYTLSGRAFAIIAAPVPPEPEPAPAPETTEDEADDEQEGDA